MQKVKVENQVLSGGVWFAAWLFTVGLLNLTFGQAVLAIVIWPYYLGTYIAAAVS